MSMRFFITAIALAPLIGVPPAMAASRDPSQAEALRAVAPALEQYRQDAIFGSLWKRPDLSPRDRSIVTLSALIARDQTIELPLYLELAAR